MQAGLAVVRSAVAVSHKICLQVIHVFFETDVQDEHCGIRADETLCVTWYVCCTPADSLGSWDQILPRYSSPVLLEFHL